MALRNLSTALRQHAGAASRVGLGMLQVSIPAVACARPLVCLAATNAAQAAPHVSSAAPRDAFAHWVPSGMRPFGTEVRIPRIAVLIATAV